MQFYSHFVENEPRRKQGWIYIATLYFREWLWDCKKFIRKVIHENAGK